MFKFGLGIYKQYKNLEKYINPNYIFFDNRPGT